MRSLIQKHPKLKYLIGLIAIAILFLTQAASCGGEDTNKGAAKENKTKIEQQDTVIEKQPGDVMPYSPTRNTIKAWAKYWQVPGRLAYVYLTDGPNDHKGGYYVLVGPPVSYCVGLTSPVKKVRVDTGDSDGDTYIPAPGIDTVYGGGDCSIFYGIDAVTNLPFTFNVGLGQNMQYFAQPNQRYDSEPLGVATFDSAKKN